MIGFDPDKRAGFVMLTNSRQFRDDLGQLNRYLGDAGAHLVEGPQWLADAGQSEARVQSFMRHATEAMTRRYSKQKDHGENARALALILRGVA